MQCKNTLRRLNIVKLQFLGQSGFSINVAVPSANSSDKRVLLDHFGLSLIKTLLVPHGMLYGQISGKATTLLGILIVA